MLNRLPIRWRLTLWYGVLMMSFMSAFGAVLLAVAIRGQSDRLDYELTEEKREIAVELEPGHRPEDVLRELQAEFAEHGDAEFEVVLANGSSIFRSKRLGDISLYLPFFRQLPVGEFVFREVTLPVLGPYRVREETVPSPWGPVRIMSALPMTSVQVMQRDLVEVFWFVGPLTYLVALVGGYWMAGRALAPVELITTTAERISAQQLDQRVEVPLAQDELSHLARTLNAMIERLQNSFDEMRRFTADAAHELRTPLTVIRTQLDVALRADRSPEQYREVLLSLRDDVVRMSELAGQLLELSREDARLEPLNKSPLQLDAVVETVLSQLAPQIKAQQLQLDVTIAPCRILGDNQRLERVVRNLIDNAIKYTPTGGSIRVELHPSEANGRGSSGVELVVRDSGVGIPAEHLPRVFDRFYRVSASRGETAGAGLGLAISRAIVAAHDGTIELTSRAAVGTTVTVWLPAPITVLPSGSSERHGRFHADETLSQTAGA